MDANAPLDDAGTADIVDLSTEDAPNTGKKRSSTAEVEPPAVKRVKLSYKASSASSRPSSPGRPHNTLWQFLNKSEQKQNAVHHTAYCKACTLANSRKDGTGKADSMKPHLIGCKHVSEEVKKWAKDWTKDSLPFGGSAASSSKEQRQPSLGRFMALKDAPMIDEEQQEFNTLLLKGTVSANLPFTWIGNEYIQEAFKFARPEIQLPTGRQLAGMQSCSCVLEREVQVHNC